MQPNNTSREVLLALREQVSADGTMHEIDVAIARWLYETGAGDHFVNYDPELFVLRQGGWVGSVDASLALLALLLPDARAEIRVGSTSCYCEILAGYNKNERHLGDAGGECGEALPSAIIMALLTALAGGQTLNILPAQQSEDFQST